MKVCFFGSFNPEYNRTSVIINGLQTNNVETCFCNSRKPFLQASVELFFKALSKDFDVLFVLFPAHLTVFPAKLVAIIKRKPLVVDKFISQHDSEIEYKILKQSSLKAWFLWQLDRLSCLLADKAFLDTQEQLEFFSKNFNIPKSKLDWFYVGANENVLKPKRKKPSKQFTALFYGWVTPIQGFEFVAKAAELLEKQKAGVSFRFIGLGRYFERVKQNYSHLKNAQFTGWIPYATLVQRISECDAVLAGHFGGTAKAKRVIPNKVFEALAMKKPTLVAKLPMTQKIFKDSKEAILVEPCNADSLKQALLFLKKNPKKATQIAENGFKLFKEKFSSKIIGGQIKQKLLEVIRQKQGH